MFQTGCCRSLPFSGHSNPAKHHRALKFSGTQERLSNPTYDLMPATDDQGSYKGLQPQHGISKRDCGEEEYNVTEPSLVGMPFYPADRL